MIKVKITPVTIEVVGHAGYAAPGFDIVCAAVSTLTQNLIKSIEALTQDPIEYTIESGKIIFKYGNVSERSKTLIDSFFIGICNLIEEYPEYIRLL